MFRKRKHPSTTYDSSTDSDSSLPRVKIPAPASPTFKLLSDIKTMIGDYHNEVVHLRLERELEQKRSTIFLMFSCLICKDTVTESSPVVPPCWECMERWLETQEQPTCPLCREPLQIDSCAKLPILRPLFEFLSRYSSQDDD